MTETERTGTRDLTYSRWHRSQSLGRYLGHREAFRCAAIDIDWCEYCRACGQPVALIETQRSTEPPKPAKVTAALARRADVRCFSVSYSCDGDDITEFRFRQLVPEPGPVVRMTPDAYAAFLLHLRTFHECGQPELIDIPGKAS